MFTEIESNSTAISSRVGADTMSVDDRRAMVELFKTKRLAGLRFDSSDADRLDQLAQDADWNIRLMVAKMIHLLDDDLCSRLAARLKNDCNSYVCKHAQRGLSRQRKTRFVLRDKRKPQQSYAEQIDDIERKYGKRAAGEIQSLADQRYALLASAVAHDIKSILTTLSSNATAINKQIDNSRSRSIVDDVDCIRRVIDAMELFSKPLPEDPHLEDLAEMFEDAIGRATAGVEGQGYDPAAVKIVVGKVPAHSVWVMRHLIVLAMTNVIQNALESFADGEQDAMAAGRIEITFRVDGSELRLFIRDTGPGIEPEVLKELKAFIPFGRNKSKRSSSGWGLPLVHRNISAHGGTVSIDSELNVGTTVSIMLPLRQTDESEELE